MKLIQNFPTLIGKELLKQIDKGRKICQKRKVKTG